MNGFAVEWDRRVRRQTTVCTYARSCCFRSLTNDAKIYWQYQPVKGWLKPWKITMVPDDVSGTSRHEMARILEHCKFYRLLLIEVAIDFSPPTGVNKDFVRHHASFGKSHRREKTKDSRPLLR
jgi:hypothetical protein